eukprot:s2634_g2.t1
MKNMAPLGGGLQFCFLKFDTGPCIVPEPSSQIGPTWTCKFSSEELPAGISESRSDSMKVLVFQRFGSGDFAVNIVPPQENPRDTERASAEKLGAFLFLVLRRSWKHCCRTASGLQTGFSGIALACQNEKLAAADVKHLSMLQQKMPDAACASMSSWSAQKACLGD